MSHKQTKTDVASTETQKTCMQAQNENTNGFTLIELLVVVLIIGILAGVALPQYQKSVAKARFVELMVVGDAISKASELYYLENGKYTNNLEELVLQIPASSHSSSTLAVYDTGHAAVVVSSTSLPMLYVIYFQNHTSHGQVDEYTGRRECRVLDVTRSDLKSVCNALTGKAGGEVGSGGGVYYRSIF